MHETSPFALPNLKEIFKQLRTGRHIAIEDGIFFQDLIKHEAIFSDLFENLGFELEKHAKGFFFFRGDEKVGDSAASMALFMFILVDFLAGKGAPIEESIMSNEFTLDELPHLTAERYVILMKEGGVSDDEGLGRLLKRMERLGFISYKESCIRFRTPAYRFLDLCLQIHEDNNMDDHHDDA